MDRYRVSRAHQLVQLIRSPTWGVEWGYRLTGVLFVILPCACFILLSLVRHSCRAQTDSRRRINKFQTPCRGWEGSGEQAAERAKYWSLSNPFFSPPRSMVSTKLMLLAVYCLVLLCFALVLFCFVQFCWALDEQNMWAEAAEHAEPTRQYAAAEEITNLIGLLGNF